MINVGKVLYILNDDFYLSIEHDAVIVKREESIVTRIPLIAISQIIIIANTIISEYLIDACSRYHISIAYISPFGRYLGTFDGKSIGNVTLRMKQYQAYSGEDRISIAKNIVLGKTINQIQLLSKYENKIAEIHDIKDYLTDSISRLLDQSTVESIRGIEGDNAVKYFSVFDQILSGADSTMKFSERSRRPPKNRFNALLSLLYTIETTTCIAAISSYGLDPYLGYLHEIHPGRESLACDLVEEFRTQIVDAFILKNVNLRTITGTDFEESEGTFSLTLKGKQKILAAWEKYKEETVYYELFQKELPMKILPFVQAQLMGQYLRGDIPEYPPFTEWS